MLRQTMIADNAKGAGPRLPTRARGSEGSGAVFGAIRRPGFAAESGLDAGRFF